MNAPAPLAVATPVDLRALAFRRLDAAGNELPDDVTEAHVITHYPAIGLMFDVRAPRKVRSLKAARAGAADVELLGRKGEWVLPERAELQALIDPAFHAPAVNPKAAPNMPDYGWMYTATPAAWSADRVWFVVLSVGGVSWHNGVSVGLVVPVLRVPASQ